MKNITIVGTGYVGLVTGVGLAEFGNKVICVDIDKDKISQLKSGLVPIYEPGLEEIIKRKLKDQFGSTNEEAENLFLICKVRCALSGSVAKKCYIKQSKKFKISSEKQFPIALHLSLY